MPPRPPRGGAGRAGHVAGGRPQVPRQRGEGFGSLTWARWSATDDDDEGVVSFSPFALLGGAPAFWAPAGVVGAM